MKEIYTDMKKISNWSILGFLIGANLSVMSAIRYFVLYPDLDKALVYVLIGILVIAVSWLYNKNLQISNTLTAVEDYLADKRLEKK